MKINVFSKLNKFFEKNITFSLLQISLVSGLIEDSCILISVSAFNMLLWFKYTKKIWPHADM